MPRIQNDGLSPSALAAARQYADDLLPLPNVIGVGAARKIVDGRPTETVGVVVYVTRKEPPANIRASERVPKKLTVNDEKVSTDVVEIRQPQLCNLDSTKYRPVRGGCQIQAIVSGGEGTGGGVFYDRHWPLQPVLLTNNHVLTDPSAPGELPMLIPEDRRNVRQPGNGDVIGDTMRIVPLLPAPLGSVGYSLEAVVDAGIVGLLPSVSWRTEVAGISGKHPFVALPAASAWGQRVLRRGMTTQLQSGTIEAAGLEMIVWSRPRSGGGTEALRIGHGGTAFLIRSDPDDFAAQQGDSGSLVVDAEGQITRGLVCASDAQRGGITFACDIVDVMSALEIDTACNTARRHLVVAALLHHFPDLLAMTGHEKLIERHVNKFDRFRALYLGTDSPERLSGALGALLEGDTGQAVADALLTDDDFRGLLDHAIGTWLVQPTVFGMLDYRLPETFTSDLQTAFTRLNHIQPGAVDTDWFEEVFRDVGGRSLREVLDRRVASKPVLL